MDLSRPVMEGKRGRKEVTRMEAKRLRGAVLLRGGTDDSARFWQNRVESSLRPHRSNFQKRLPKRHLSLPLHACASVVYI